MRVDRFILQSKETMAKTKEKKAIYTSTDRTRIIEMTLSDIYSDRQAKAIMEENRASEQVVNNAKLFETLTQSPQKYVELAEWTNVTVKGKDSVTVSIIEIRITF